MNTKSFNNATIAIACLWIANTCGAAAIPPTSSSSTPGTAAQDQRLSEKNGLDKTETLISPMPSAVNPMTGKSLRSEEMEHILREKVIEARIAEQELSIAKSRYEAKKVGNEKSVESSPVRVPDAVRNFGTAPVKPVEKPKVAKKASPSKKADEVVSAAPLKPVEQPRFVGVMESEGTAVAMVSYQGRVIAVKEGTTVNGIRVSSISTDSALINSTPARLERSVGAVILPETRAAVQPGSAFAATAPQQVKGVVVQGINTPAMQPAAPGDPLNGANTQPVPFPSNLYNR